MRALVTNNLTGLTEEVEIEEVEGGAISKSIVPEPQAPTMEEMAVRLMETQTQLQDVQDALDFLIMGGI